MRCHWAESFPQEGPTLVCFAWLYFLHHLWVQIIFLKLLDYSLSWTHPYWVSIFVLCESCLWLETCTFDFHTLYIPWILPSLHADGCYASWRKDQLVLSMVRASYYHCPNLWFLDKNVIYLITWVYISVHIREYDSYQEILSHIMAILNEIPWQTNF